MVGRLLVSGRKCTTSGTKATGLDRRTRALTGWDLTMTANNIMRAIGMGSTADLTTTTAGTKTTIGTAIGITTTAEMGTSKTIAEWTRPPAYIFTSWE